jgi:DNA-binding NarL/FixJ family response regulator
MKCLIMERHPLTMLAIELVVGKYFPDWEIATASCLDEALGSLVAPDGQPVAVVLAGLNVPGGAALTLIRRMQASAPAGATAWIAMADEPDLDLIKRCMAAGATTVFSKTSGMEQLVHALQSASDASMRAPDMAALSGPLSGPMRGPMTELITEPMSGAMSGLVSRLTSGLTSGLTSEPPSEPARASLSEPMRQLFGEPRSEGLKTLPAVPAPPIRLTSRQRDVAKLVLAGYSNKKISYTLNLSYGTIKNYMFSLMRLLSVNSRLEMVLRIQEQGLFCHSHGEGNEIDAVDSMGCDCSAAPALANRRLPRAPMVQHLRGAMYVAP